MTDDNKTRVISLADAMARIEMLEACVEALQSMAITALSSISTLEAQLHSATQVTEAA